MKIAEALTERKALQEKVARLRARLTANARVQEGDEPAERPAALLAEVADAAAALETLIVRINRTNLTATLADEPRLTLMEAVARRDMLKLRFAALSELIAAAAPAPGRFFAVTRSEIKFRATVDVAELQQQLDALAREIRELDARLQAANWAVDLIA
jgi:oligoendopeptidase F